MKNRSIKSRITDIALKKLLLILTLCLVTFFIIPGVSCKDDTPVPQQKDPPSGVAIIITGAAARIPQEAALLEELHKRGLLKDVVFISGVSSGAINAVMLNGILSGKMSWKEYKGLLFELESSDIFRQNGKRLPVNTEPARNLFKKILEDKLGYHLIGDLPFTTAISISNIENVILKKKVYRMCSRKINAESDTTLSLVDIVMASTAIPLVFPSTRIKNASTIPDVRYMDGAFGDDHVPYSALLEFQNYRNKDVEKVYVISRKTDTGSTVGDELRSIGFENIKTSDRFGISVENILRNDIIKKLVLFEKEAPQLQGRIFVWIPEFEKEFPLLDFGNLQEQYELTSSWAKNHNPVPLYEFLEPYRKPQRSIDSLLLRPISRIKRSVRNP